MWLKLILACVLFIGVASVADARTTAQTRTTASTRTAISIDRHTDASHIKLETPGATGFLQLETGGGWLIIEPQASQRSPAQ